MLQPIMLTAGKPGSLQHIDCLQEAHQAVTEERKLLRAEADAFSDFCARIDAIDCEPKPRESATPPSTTQDTITAHSSPGPQQGDTPIRDAYVETVMDTPHYEREYADSYRVSIAAEFGNEFAAMLAQASVITPRLKQQVLTAAQEAKAQRKQLISTLNQEASAVKDANTELHAIAEEINAIQSRPFHDCTADELQQLHTDLDALSTRCQTIATRRQTGDLEPRLVAAGLNSHRQLTAYCYETLSVTYPVLHAVATISERITTTNQRITDLLNKTAL